jgi:hypothetical protein
MLRFRPPIVLVACLGTCLLVASQAQASTVTLTFDELPTQAADGLTFSGVTFGFTEDGVSSTDAQYNTPGPDPAQYLSSPVLSGPLNPSVAMQLLMTFAVPIATLDFGIALNTLDAETPGATLAVYDDQGNLLNSYEIETSVVVSGGFSEALFSYGDSSIPGSLSGAAIGKAALTFPSTLPADLFAIDNVTFVTTPEPGTGLGLLSGIAILIAVSKRTS